MPPRTHQTETGRKPAGSSRRRRPPTVDGRPPDRGAAPAPAPGLAAASAAGPALGLIELSSVARGMVVADAMAKRALVTLVQARPITPGKFVVVVSGGEEEVEQAMDVGLAQAQAGGALIDRLYLAKADPQLAPAMAGTLTAPASIDALGILETFSVAAAVLAADRAVKAAEVRLLQMRLARGLGGRAFFVLTGELHQVEAAIAAGRSIIHDGMLHTTEIIPRPHPDLVEVLLAQ